MSTPCYSCASTPEETEFGPKPGRGKNRLCLNCAEELARSIERARPVKPRPVVSRASYRAAKRHREGQPQMDLVDLLVPGP